MSRVFAVLLVLALAALALPTASAGNAPAYAAGDFWDYNVLFTDVTDFGKNSTGSTRVTVGGYELIREGTGASTRNHTVVLLQSESLYNTRTAEGGITRTVATEKRYLRPTDGAVVRNVTDVSVFTSFSDTASEGRHTQADWNPPCQGLQYPLFSGAGWRLDCRLTLTRGGSTTSGLYNTTYAVRGQESITVPAGTFNAFVVENATAGKVRLRQYYVPEVCGPVRVEVLDKFERLVSRSDLTAYRCAGKGAPYDPSQPTGPTPPT
ncbi:MAG TPA: hypothetical protein VM889_06475, partial [Candidatus Thermoplasmatota archaeon]|nr:hypothetical protein [Candidatus Thermoplasmatota archaeon]